MQAGALNNMGLVPNLFLMLECPDAVMIERACGRRMDPVTRKIYHLKVGERSLSPRNVPSLSRARYRLQYAPPESDEIKDRLIQRSDDTEAKMGNRIVQFHKNVDAVKGEYASITETVSSNRGKADIFVDVAAAIEKRVFGK